MSTLAAQPHNPVPLAPLPPQAAWAADPVWRMSVETYHAMTTAGALTENDRVELLEGVLVFKMAIDEIHVAVCALLDTLITRLLGSTEMSYRKEAPVTFRDSEPEPDGAIAVGPPFHFARLGRKPGEAEVLWVAEVSNTTLRTDRITKRRIYAHAGIPIYWIVNLAEREIEVYSNPDSGADEPHYRTVTPYRAGQRVPLIVSGRVVGEITFDDVLPAGL